VPLSCDLLVVGAGAKGSAVAIKAHVINSLGLGPVSVTVVEALGPAAAWRDGNGVTSSREILALSPSKDVGFPYQSARAFGERGAAIDRAMTAHSWQRYLIEEGRYADWVDAGTPCVQRRVYGAYLAWVLARASNGVNVVHGRVDRVSLARGEDERWEVDVTRADGSTLRLGCRAFALTGQGAQRVLSHDAAAAAHVLDCESGRMQIARVPSEQSSDIAIVGGGESALSCLEFVRALRPDAQLTVYTANLPMSRVESFLENRVYSRPDEVDWSALHASTRRDFIVRSDRGVFGAERVAPFAYDESCRFVGGRVTHIAAAPDGEKLDVAYVSTAGAAVRRHDYVINCTGYDLLEQLRRLLAGDAQNEVERRIGPLWGHVDEWDLAVGRALELEGMQPRLHVPGLAALSQGPGFSTLGALGLIGDRMLEPLVRERERGSGDRRAAGGEGDGREGDGGEGDGEAGGQGDTRAGANAATRPAAVPS
jgi:mycobactin lysine-N-oxygenase